MQRSNINPRSLRDLGWPEVLEALSARTSTSRGRALALGLPFLESTREIDASFDRIAESRELLRKELSLPVTGADDVRDQLSLASKGMILEAAQLQACARLIRAASRVRSFLHEHRGEAPILAGLAQELPEVSSLASRIETTFEPSGRIRDDASGVLSSLRDRSRGLHREIKGRLEELMGEQDFAMTLRDDYVSIRGDRYVVPVNASFRSKVPGIVHNASNSGQTLFVEPQQIVGLGNDLSIAESMAAEEERRVLQELSGDLGDRSAELLEAVEVLARLDQIQASARLADELGAVAPTLVQGRDPLVLRSVRHPLLVLQGKRVIANDIRLEEGQRALVVSGPNAGGKTVTITTVGLCALLVRAGLPIPADPGSAMPIFRSIDTAIGDDQDLAQDLSTFSAHLQTLREILEHAKEGSLVLIDEIAAGTDPREGAALASAVLAALVDRGTLTLVTTHLEELKAMGFSDPRFANASVGLDPTTLAPTFRLELGAAGLSSALEIAARIGIPPAVLEIARARLHGGSALAAALEELEGERRQGELERLRLREERQRMEELQTQATRAREEAERARNDAEALVREELRQEFEAARKEVGEILARLTSQPKVAVADAVRAQKALQDRAEAQAHAQAKARAQRELAGERVAAGGAAPIRPGSRVRVVSLGSEAEVIELGRSDALVLVGSLKTRVPLDDLVLLFARKSPTPTQQAKGRRSGKLQAAEVAAAPISGPAGRCDVRGLRADEAAREIEAFLDRAYSEGPSSVSILHGHGSGALKRLVRETLASSPYVSLVRPGERHEGGDAITIVELRE